MHELVLLALPLLFFVGCDAYAFVGTPHYIKQGHCESHRVCTYSYSGLLTHGVDEEAQNVTVSASFAVSCESRGEYAYKKATKYCLSVTEGRLKHKESTTELDQKLSAGWFCFVQTEDGTISIVLHPKNESQEVVNFKKALVSGFQANFAGKNLAEETDPDSDHLSRYRYIVKPTKHPPSGHMVRSFNQNDIGIFAVRSTIPVSYTKEEDIEYNEGVLSRSRGETHVVIPHYKQPRAHVQMSHGGGTQESVMNHARSQESQTRRRRRRGVVSPHLQSYFPSVTLDQFSIHSSYSLELVQCSPSLPRNRRDVQDSLSGETVSSLRAFSTPDRASVHLHKVNITAVLETIHQNPEDVEKVEELRKYLTTEDKVNSTSAISQAAHYLNKMCRSHEPDDVAMRLKMYPIITSLANHEAHQALLSCLEYVRDSTAWNALLVNIALLATPSSDLVAKLEELLKPGAVGDSTSLILVYGALASRADHELQSRMILYLSSCLQESTGDTDNSIALIHALGNAGSSQTITLLLGIIDNDDLAVQLATVTALRKHTCDVRVVTTFLGILGSSNTSASIVGAIASVLTKDVETSGVTDVDISLAYAKALVSSSRTLNNSYTSELVGHYLHQLERYDVRIYRRLRRDVGNWAWDGHEYNMIALQKARHEDSEKYPKNCGYLWSRQLGVRDFNLQVVAGMFTGATENREESKIQGRVVARVNVFGKSLTAVEVDVLRNDKFGSGVRKLVHVTVGEYVLLNSEASTDSKQLPNSLAKGTEYPVEEIKMELFVGVATVETHFVVYAHLDSAFRVNGVDTGNENIFFSRGFLSPSLKIRIKGSSKFSVLGTEGGASLDGAVGYGFEAEGKVAGCRYGAPAFGVSTSIKEEWPAGYIHLSSWYKPQLTVPCGFEHCTRQGDKVEDSTPIERWVLEAESSGGVWEDSVFTGPVKDWQQCPLPPKESEFRAWYNSLNWLLDSDVGYTRQYRDSDPQ